ncbi:response regulator transcription factor [Candidatus Poriferisodalis sp.]|uniref:response regulator transcription factor n=1 Tax=Candidatus Poriferisodalis sp. TaxID=3101277 RepID=UPI003B020B3A
MDNASGPRVLVVDDEENIRFIVRTALEMDGFDVEVAESGTEAVERVESHRPQVIVLDVMLPDVDGFTVLQRIRDRGCHVPVVFLTARDATEDRVRGLTTGGADYVVKPFAVAELVARVRLRLEDDQVSSAGRQLRCADLVMDDDTHRVTRAGQPVNLSPTEYKLLHYLLVNSGRVLSRYQILDHVWSYDFGGNSAVVDTYISYLRRKIDDVEPQLIQTIRGIGFTLRVEA